MTGVVFLDRDGTIIVEREYLSDPGLVALEHGAVAGLSRLSAAGFVLVVLTNQSGIARGYFDLAAAERVNARVAELLAEAGVPIAGWYICPHADCDGCDCRKPAPGLALTAQRALGTSRARGSSATRCPMRGWHRPLAGGAFWLPRGMARALLQRRVPRGFLSSPIWTRRRTSFWVCNITVLLVS